MNERQLADRIGNIDDKLVEEAKYRQRRGGGWGHRLLAAAAVLALMAVSFTVGALAFSREIPAEQETIELPNIGLTLILPDSWKGRYTFEREGPSADWFFINSIREKAQSQGFEGGMLFYISLWPEQLTEKQAKEEEDGEWKYARNEYIMTTKEGTYFLYYASDVQYDPSDPEQEALYRQMESEISQIRFVVDGVLSD